MTGGLEMAQPRMTHRVGAGMLAVAAMAFALSGCSLDDSLPYFDQKQQDDDRLPSDVGGDQIDRSTTRLVGLDSDGDSYFVARALPGIREGEVCLIVAPTDNRWAASCSAQLPIQLGMPSGKNVSLNSQQLDAGSGEWVGDHVRIET